MTLEVVVYPQALFDYDGEDFYICIIKGNGDRQAFGASWTIRSWRNLFHACHMHTNFTLNSAGRVTKGDEQSKLCIVNRTKAEPKMLLKLHRNINYSSSWLVALQQVVLVVSEEGLLLR